MNGLVAAKMLRQLSALTGKEVYTATGGSTTTVVNTAHTQANDHWNGSLVVFITGSNAGLARRVNDFTASSDTITVNTLPSAVAAGDQYIIVPDEAADISSIGTGLDTIGDGIEALNGSLYGSVKVVPFRAAALSIAGAAGAWATGSWVEAAGDTGSDTLQCLGFLVDTIAGKHHAEVAVGAAASEVAITEFATSTTGQVNFSSAIIPPNSRLAIRTATLGGGSQTVTGWLLLKKVA